eukprot:403367241
MQTSQPDETHKLQQTHGTPDKRKNSVDDKNENEAINNDQHIRSQDEGQSFKDQDNTDSNINAGDGGSGDVKIIKKKVKKNGFALPFHPFQIISWFIFGLDVYAFYFINVVTFAYLPAVSAVIGTVFTLLVIAVLYYAILSTRSDPTDPTVYAQREAERQGKYFDNTQFELFCEVCDTHVQNSSKHCGQCNRCVDGFDHHCRWLNNCIGKSNYLQFFRVILSFFFMCLMHNAVDAAVLILINSSDSYLLTGQNKNFYKTGMNTEFHVLLIASLIFNTAAIGFLGHLISFHIMLQHKKLTTFEYIQIKLGRQNHKSKIFREVNHEEEDQDEENQHEIQANLDTDNVQALKKETTGIEIKQIDDEIKDILNSKDKIEENLIDSQSQIQLQQKITAVGQVAKKSQKTGFLCFGKKQQKLEKVIDVEQGQQQQTTTHQHKSMMSQDSHLLFNNSNTTEIQLQGQQTDRGQNNRTPQSQDKLGPNEDQTRILHQAVSQNSSSEKSNVSSPKETPSLLSNDQHMLSVIKFGAGGDDQSHVQNPLSKSVSLNKQRVNNINRILNKNKSELETIHEKIREEDVAQSVGGFNMKNIDIEESYSFSLRNYNASKSSNYQVPNPYSNSNMMSQSMGRMKESQHQILTNGSEKGRISYVTPYQSEFMNTNVNDLKNLSFQQSKTQADYEDFQLLKKGTMSELKQKQIDGANKNVKLLQMNNNFIDHNRIGMDQKGSSPSNMVSQFNKFSSHMGYQGGDKENMNSSFTDKQNESIKEITINESENYLSRNNQRTSLPQIVNNKSKVTSVNRGGPNKQNAWMGPMEMINQSVAINESIVSYTQHDEIAQNTINKNDEQQQSLFISQSLKSFV